MIVHGSYGTSSFLEKYFEFTFTILGFVAVTCLWVILLSIAVVFASHVIVIAYGVARKIPRKLRLLSAIQAKHNPPAPNADS